MKQKSFLFSRSIFALVLLVLTFAWPPPAAFAQVVIPQADVEGLTAALAAKVPESRTVNGYSLSSNLTLTKADIGLANAVNIAAHPLGNRVSFIGDSLTDYGEGYPYYAEALSLGKIRLWSVNSNPGHTTTAMLTDIAQITGLSPRPNVCVLMGGTNDAIAGTAIGTFSANITSLCDTLVGAGITPVLVTIPPLSGANNALARSYNDWLKRFAIMRGYSCVDVFAALVDPATGEYASGYNSGDGVHWSGAGNKAVGALVAATLNSLLPAVSLPVSGANTGGTNLVANSWMLIDTNADGISDSWSASPSSGFSYSRVVDARGWRWQRITLSGASGQKQLLSALINYGASTFDVGDRILISARIRSGQSGATAQMKLQFTLFAAGYTNPFNVILPVPVGATQQIEDGLVVRELVVPAGRTFGLWTFLVGPGDGTYDVSQPTVINLTKLGF